MVARRSGIGGRCRRRGCRGRGWRGGDRGGCCRRKGSRRRTRIRRRRAAAARHLGDVRRRGRPRRRSARGNQHEGQHRDDAPELCLRDHTRQSTTQENPDLQPGGRTDSRGCARLGHALLRPGACFQGTSLIFAASPWRGPCWQPRHAHENGSPGARSGGPGSAFASGPRLRPLRHLELRHTRPRRRRQSRRRTAEPHAAREPSTDRHGLLDDTSARHHRGRRRPRLRRCGPVHERRGLHDGNERTLSAPQRKLRRRRLHLRRMFVRQRMRHRQGLRVHPRQEQRNQQFVERGQEGEQRRRHHPRQSDRQHHAEEDP